MNFNFFFIQFLNGISIGMLLFIIASGLSLMYGVMGILNLAHGSFYMLAAFFLSTAAIMNVPGWFWISLLLIPLLVSSVGLCLETIFLRRMYDREKIYSLIFTFAWVLVFDDLALILWGREYLTVPLPETLSGSIKILGFDYPTYYVFINILGPIVAIAQWLIIHRTNFGMYVRACASDKVMLDALGINIKKIFTIIFSFACGLAALGGVLVAPLKSISSGMGLGIIIESFIVVVIGGMGSLMGALIGALIIGQIQAFGILILPRYAMILLYALLAFVLVTRPQGLFGTKEA